MENNLFYYATSELSQDALLCYIMSYAAEGNKNKNIDIYNIAKELINLMGITDEEITVTSINKQYKNIDVLIEVNNKYNIIIEDKTFTSQHSNQINRYKEALELEKRENIICVYYKIVEQSHPEEGVVNITRIDILDILKKHNTGDKVIEDYTNYLKWIDEDVNAYKTTPIKEWREKYHNAYRGFFTHLVNDEVINTKRFGGWSYINNPSGGFWGLWWYSLEDSILENNGLSKTYLDNLYLQISDNQITVKIKRADKISNEEINQLKDIRWEIFNYFCSKISGDEFKKNRFTQGRHMTVGYIEYDENNYKDKIKVMEEIMKNIENGDLKVVSTV